MQVKPISAYLAILTPAQEDVILGGHMHPGNYTAPCLVGLANRDIDGWSGGVSMPWFQAIRDELDRFTYAHDFRLPYERLRKLSRLGKTELAFDYLCDKYGDDRVGAMIRNRILRNQLRRTLTAPIEVMVHVE